MTVKEFLQIYLETDMSPISVNDKYTYDSFEEIIQNCPEVFNADDGIVYFDRISMFAYYRLFSESDFHFVELMEDAIELMEDDIELFDSEEEFDY